MKVLYLFNGQKKISEDLVKAGLESDNKFQGILRLKKFGVEAEVLSVEDCYSPKSVSFFRKYLNIHFAHLPIFHKIFNYDLVFSSTAFSSLMLWTLVPWKKPAWVNFDFSISGYLNGRKNFKQKLLYWLIFRTSGVVTLSKDEEHIMKIIFPDKPIKSIYFGTDTDFFKPQPQTAEEDFILSVGRDPGRDFGTLMEAAKGLNIKLKLTAKPESLKKFGPLPDFVSIHDFTPVQLVEQYAKSKIVVLPLNPIYGKNDAMGCSTLVEAMSMGKAIVATRTSTMEDYIQSGDNGVLVPQGDIEALKLAIIDLIHDDQKRQKIGTAAREFVLQYCGADKFAENLASFFNQIHDKNNKKSH